MTANCCRKLKRSSGSKSRNNNYQKWSSSTRRKLTCCGKHLKCRSCPCHPLCNPHQMGPVQLRLCQYLCCHNSNQIVITLIMIIVPSILFYSGVGDHYITEYHLFYPLIIQSASVLLCLVSLVITHVKNPGVIRTNIWPTQQCGTAGLAEKINYNFRGPNYKQQVMVGGRLVELKWCSTCHVFRPPRSFHCYLCNHCVERFDHHCPWLGTCVGNNNYVWFSIFINSVLFVCIWTLTFSVLLLDYAQRSYREQGGNHSNWELFQVAVRRESSAFIVSVFVFVAIWFVLGLASFHWFLVCVGKTTNEQLRNLVPIGPHFSRSAVGNFIDMCCCKLPSPHRHNSTGNANTDLKPLPNCADGNANETEMKTDRKAPEYIRFIDDQKVVLMNGVDMYKVLQTRQQTQTVEASLETGNEPMGKPQMMNKYNHIRSQSENSNSDSHLNVEVEVEAKQITIEITQLDDKENENENENENEQKSIHVEEKYDGKYTMNGIDLSKSNPRQDTEAQTLANEHLYTYDYDSNGDSNDDDDILHVNRGSLQVDGYQSQTPSIFNDSMQTDDEQVKAPSPDYDSDNLFNPNVNVAELELEQES